MKDARILGARTRNCPFNQMGNKWLSPILNLLAEIRNGLNKGLAPGSDQFKEEVGTLAGRRLKPKKG